MGISAAVCVLERTNSSDLQLDLERVAEDNVGIQSTRQAGGANLVGNPDRKQKIKNNRGETY